MHCDSMSKGVKTTTLKIRNHSKYNSKENVIIFSRLKEQLLIHIKFFWGERDPKYD